jgi:hypothetical protein
MWAADADRLVELLSQRGYEEIGGPPPARQRNLRRDDADIHITLLEPTAAGGVRTAAAPAEWGEWPKGMIDAQPVRIGAAAVPVISPEAQIEIKRRFREFPPRAPGARQGSDGHRRHRSRAALCSIADGPAIGRYEPVPGVVTRGPSEAPSSPAAAWAPRELEFPARRVAST